MEEKLNRISDTLTQVQIDLAEIRKDVNYHILRTDQNDEKIQMIAEAVKPVQEHVAIVNGLGRIVVVITAIVAAIASVIQLLGGK